jgi:hypothetical protein
MSMEIVVPVVFEMLDEAVAARRAGMDPRTFRETYGDLAVNPITPAGRQIRKKQYRSTDLAKRSYTFHEAA